MIRYTLRCDKTHEFEAWFASSDAYDAQAARGLVTCAACGSSHVDKALMAPNVVTARKKAATRASANAAMPAGQPAPVATSMPPEMLAMLRQVRDHVRANSDYVGNRFADEARKIHYQEAKARTIHGEASLSDVAALHDEGIDIHPLPVLPEDKN